MKMFKEDKEAWLAALRSGEYKQGIYTLHNTADDSYCCLGVLQSCLMDGKIEKRHNINYQLNYDAAPSEDFYNLFGIVDYNEDSPADSSVSYESHLMGMNDEGTHTFSEIADWIEKNVKTHKHGRSDAVQTRLDAVLECLESQRC